MEKDMNEGKEYQTSKNPQDTLMNRVNQAFDQMAEDVRNMIGENEERKNR